MKEYKVMRVGTTVDEFAAELNQLATHRWVLHSFFVHPGDQFYDTVYAVLWRDA